MGIWYTISSSLLSNCSLFVVLHILKYVKKALGQGLWWQGKYSNAGYCDAIWVDYPSDRRSTI